MCLRSKLRMLLFIVLMLSITLPNTGSAKTKKKTLPEGTPVMWRKPADISHLDLYLGPGGAALRPDLRQITFIKQETGGHSKKYRVRDASGREWVAKIGREAQSETAAVRLLWAIGYETEVNYLVPRVTIAGKGTFRNVRFEARPSQIKRLDDWHWKQNPFLGTPEFQGLKIMMALLNNWDLKDSNNKILYIDDGNGPELRYIISDLGATFGYAASIPFFWRIMRSRNSPAKYAKTKFLQGVKGNRVELHYYGKNRGLFHYITVQDAKWLGSLLAELSERQIRDAFRAANYTPAQINLLTNTVRSRTEELLSLLPTERIGRKQREQR
jgi:hypothetical protein